MVRTPRHECRLLLLLLLLLLLRLLLLALLLLLLRCQGSTAKLLPLPSHPKRQGQATSSWPRQLVQCRMSP